MRINTLYPEQRPWLFGLDRPIYKESGGILRDTGHVYPFEIHYWGENQLHAYERFFADYGTPQNIDWMRFSIDQIPWVLHDPAEALARLYYRGTYVRHWLNSTFERDRAPVNMQHDPYAIRKDIALSLAKGIVESAYDDYLQMKEAASGQSLSE
jgi:hypothetical protein